LLNFFQPSISNITFRPATVIIVLCGVLYGPWVGLVSGLVGKTLMDVSSGWGFNWYGTVAYGLIGFVSGLIYRMRKDFGPARDIVGALLSGGLGVLVSALFLFVVELLSSDINLKVALLRCLQPEPAGSLIGDINLNIALLDFFLPEFVGNLTVVILLLPLCWFAINSIRRSR
jgi:LytS/YehU family sensor histidine kinase